MKNIRREALLVPIIGLLILSYHMGYFLSDWPFWQVYAILALAYFAGRFGLKKRASSKDEPQEGKTTGQ
ncbi:MULTISPECIES: hypothetical protein [Enterobacteriaceae]|uniref:Uncharacterized protein n=1 Tax=Escherichia coli TaxID=562 RepID=A0A8T3US68_ECOLX|nr:MULTISPECIES: hypothetical protein [Enterobacteriaceae]EBM6644978.1 hypothetical protein [Salmonella enterica subsp. enterica serovar Senftenberg]EIF1294531.1 hypothetical protein [Salmonella enterica]EIF2004298.1 hypothetical protein [Salmonella enterica subsp. enterica serovar Montevideo]EKB0025839.1 hypothetical protein [Salmonella enterica subsp. enterica serovar Schwarzengrund]ELU1427718.1 hypothetical protein [Raoultella planticola]HBM7596185.1 hypothetical protein [Enterobacter horm